MGIVKFGDIEIECSSVIVTGNVLKAGDRVIQLANNYDTIQFKFTDCDVDYFKSACEVLVTGNCGFMKSYGNVLVVGNINRASVGGSRYYNTTAAEYYKKTKKKFSTKLDSGKRVIVRLSGNFESVELFNECMPEFEVSYTGVLNELRCDSDIILKGNVESSRSELATYRSNRLK